MRYPADPPTVDEIVTVMRHAADDRHGRRVRAMIVVLWRAGLRIQEALTSIYLQGIDPEEIIATVHMRQAPMMSASAGLRL
jgi:site-specific recombinase XerC